MPLHVGKISVAVVRYTSGRGVICTREEMRVAIDYACPGCDVVRDQEVDLVAQILATARSCGLTIEGCHVDVVRDVVAIGEPEIVIPDQQLHLVG